MMVLIKSESNYHIITKPDTVPKPDWHFTEKFINLLSVFQIYFRTCFATTDVLSEKAHSNYLSLGVWWSCNSIIVVIL